MNQLTETENKIAHHIAQGYAGKEIADKLCVSSHTVHTHARSIRKKLKANNIADITRLYILSLDNPKLILKAFMFGIIQIGMILTATDVNARKPTNTTVSARSVKTARKNDIA